MNRLTRYLLPAVALSAACASALAAQSGKPNILVIVADDLGWGELTVQGHTKDIPTPNIDSIANNGVRFTSGYVSGPYCSPTRAGLLTGRYQQRFGHEFNPGRAEAAETAVGLPLTEKTLADRLKTAGYATGWFGKSHLGYEPQFHPQKRGFDQFFGFLGGAHTYLDATPHSRNAILRGTEPVKEIDYTTDAFAREASAFIEQKKSEPWFVYLPFNAVHGPLEATSNYLERFSHIRDPKRQKFAAMLSAMDDGVGSVLSRLRDTGQEDNTLVFFISDNGGPTQSISSKNGPLRGYKSQTWEGGIRVVWFAQWKGKIPAGKVDDRPVIQLDIPATALAAAGVESQPDWKIEGVNLLPFLTGEKTGAPHEALYWRFGQQIAIRKGDWKLVKAPGGGVDDFRTKENATTENAHLYNLAQDIGEKTNLAEKEPGKVKELAAAWEKWNEGNVPPKWLPGKKARKRRAAEVTAAKPAAGSDDPPAPVSAAATNPPKTPEVANRAFRITAQIEPAGPNGVIAAQGGKANGYALLLKENKLAFSLRSAGELTTTVAEQPLPPGSHKVEARIAADGKVTLSVDGADVAEGKPSTLIKREPKEALTIGGDGRSAVGEYEAPHAFSGKVENVKVESK